MRHEERRLEAPERRVPGICANDGCRRPSQTRLCDACALEWSLFHREERRECGSGAESVPRRL